jgi:hypothetical protein
VLDERAVPLDASLRVLDGGLVRGRAAPSVVAPASITLSLKISRAPA